MKKLSIALAAALATGFGASAASATVINFAAEGVNGGERGVADGTIVNTAALGGLNLQFAGGVGGASSDFAYFNGAANGRLPGLGTCTALNKTGTCSPGNDDNITVNEFVNVAFLDGPFNVRQLSFNGQNASLDGSLGLVKITTDVGAAVAGLVMTFAAANVFDFGFVNWIQFDFVDTEFVVAQISDIPVPGALPLLLSGLAGLGFAASRRKKA
ncbi:MAG: hypothetical protein ACOZAA_00755 [Pseudomonadota bacterium]